MEDGVGQDLLLRRLLLLSQMGADHRRQVLLLRHRLLHAHGWVTWNKDGTRTYFGSDGAALSGWQTIGGKRYYFDPAKQYHGARWETTIDGKFYYFDTDCSMYTGLITWNRDGSKSFFDSNGVAVKGWKTVSGKTYYFGDSYYSQWEQTIDGKFYYFDTDYSMRTGWVTWNKDGTRTYFGSDGAALPDGRPSVVSATTSIPRSSTTAPGGRPLSTASSTTSTPTAQCTRD